MMMRCAAALKEDVVKSLVMVWAEVEVVGKRVEANKKNKIIRWMTEWKQELDVLTPLS